MEANVQPGTRCECESGGVSNCHGWHGDVSIGCGCRAEAVRMVVVRPVMGKKYSRKEWDTLKAGIPLCAPCAEYHEARQKAGA